METDPCKRAPELKPRYLHLLFMCSFSFIFFLSFFHYTHLGSRWFCKIPRGSLRRISYLFVYWYAGKSLLSKRNPRQILFPFFINHHFRGRRPEGTFCKHDTTGSVWRLSRARMGMLAHVTLLPTPWFQSCSFHFVREKSPVESKAPPPEETAPWASNPLIPESPHPLRGPARRRWHTAVTALPTLPPLLVSASTSPTSFSGSRSGLIFKKGGGPWNSVTSRVFILRSPGWSCEPSR